MEFTNSQSDRFRGTLYAYYEAHGRHGLPWRQAEPDGSFDPYKILVSEIMLQQTQVARVTPKYQAFLLQFPTVSSLAGAELGQVLRAWSGLGYNRRAKYLHETAKAINLLGFFPNSISELVKLPGIGKNTAGAVLAYAFNTPVVFVETNIRTAYIHHFFNDQISVTDKEIEKLIGSTLDQANPRQFYWALMDYGSYLKQTVGNLNKLSKYYNKQSAFAGSMRQLRGEVLRQLAQTYLTKKQLQQLIQDERLPEVLTALKNEGLIRLTGMRYHL